MLRYKLVRIAVFIIIVLVLINALTIEVYAPSCYLTIITA